MTPRSVSLCRLTSWPSTLTCPPLASSRPPSRCSSVLLPEPDVPTIATRSPAATSRSTPISTGTSTSPWWKVLRRSRQAITGPLVPLLITRHSSLITHHSSLVTHHSSLVAQRLGRVDLRRPPAGVDRRQH